MTRETPSQTKELRFRVAEALPKDVGRGVVRLDPGDLARLGVDIGDVVEIVGERATVARAMPAHAAQRGRDLIQLDGILRANSRIALDEQVSVHRTAVRQAHSVVLAPVDGGRRPWAGSAQARYLAHLLEGIPVVPGDRVRVDTLGARAQTFHVVETNPAGAVLIGRGTAIHCEGEAKGRGAVTYEDIGGLRDELRRIREMIELPLRYPEAFEHLGIEAPKGVLFHGPPGTGKTLIGRAVAHEVNAHFAHISGPEIMDKWYGASEAHLRKLFEEAERRAPAIIFIDEIDAIAPKREEIGGDRQVERRVVAQLLALMDGLESRGQVTVLAATNIPNTLDPALRRPGRFDREISVGVPDKNGRFEILEIHCRGMPLADDVDVAKLAAMTHGFVGADLAALCREAAMSALRRLMPDIDFMQPLLPYDKLVALRVTWDDFMSAFAEVEPSAIREIFTEIPDVGWDDVGGLDDVKRQLVEAVEWPLKHSDLYSHLRLAPPKGILLHGAPGTGKTLLAKAAAKESQVNFISVKGAELLSKWIGESERAVRDIFKKAKQASPCIVFFDELDALAPRRGGSADSHVTERVVAQLLGELDGIEELKGVLVLGATNRLDIVDPALLRPGRFEIVIELPIPDVAAREAILRVHTRGRPLAAGVDLTALAERAEGLTGADLEGLCRRAGQLALGEFVDRHGAPASAAAVRRLRICPQHFEAALAALVPRRT